MNPTDQVEPLSAENAEYCMDECVLDAEPRIGQSLRAIAEKRHRVVDLSKHVVCAREPTHWVVGIHFFFSRESADSYAGRVRSPVTALYSESPEAT